MKDRQILSYLADQAWAILPSTLVAMREIVLRHASGVKLSIEEIEERIGPRAGKPQPASGAVAVVPLWGVIVPHGGMMVDASTPGTGLDEWLQMFQAAVDDPNVSAVVLDVNSPGGSAEGVTEAAAQVRAARAKKPVYAVANYLIASAAYAIASQADTLLASPSSQVGSIGVYTIHEDISGALAAEGVTPTVIQAPEDGFKTEGNPFGPLTADALAHKQDMVNAYYRLFVSDVAKGRGIDASTVEANYGRGRLLTAQAALGAAMVDGIATVDQTVAALLAGRPAVKSARSELIAASRNERGFAVELLGVGDWPANALSFTGGTSPEQSTFNGDITIVIGDQNTVEDEDAPDAEDATDPGTTGTSAATVAAAPAPILGGGNHTSKETNMETVSIDGKPPTIEELAAHRDHLNGQIDDLNNSAAGRMFTADEESQYATLVDGRDTTEKTIDQLKSRDAERQARIKNAASVAVPATGGLQIVSTGTRRIPENPHDVGSYRAFATSMEDMARKLTEGARFVNEHASYEATDDGKIRARVEKLLKTEGETAAGKESFAHRMLITADPAFEAAFGKRILGKPLSARENDLILSAVSVTGLSTETPIPITIDPTVLLDSDGVYNPMRRLARTVTITGNVWRGIATDGVAWTYDQELAAIDPQTPTYRGPEKKVERSQCEVQFSIEVDQDWGAFRGELATIVADAKNVSEADKFLNGTGTNEPEGLIWKLDDDGGSVVTTETSGTLVLTDVEALPDAMPPRFDANASWIATKAFYSDIRSLAGAEGRIDVWVPLSQGFASPGNGALPYTLLGYGASNASEMSSDFTTPGDAVAVLGDYQRGFIIIDRVGMNVELDPLVRDTNGKLVGARALFFYARNTSMVLSVNAFRMLEIKS